MITCKICGREFMGAKDPKIIETLCHPCKIRMKKEWGDFMADLEIHDDILDRHMRRGKYEGDPPRDGHDYV